MAFKSKEQYPLLSDPSKKTYCHVDPKSGRPCRVHFHKQALSTMTPADDSSFSTWDDPFSTDPFKDWDPSFLGYDYGVLMHDLGFTADELERIRVFPPASKVDKPVTVEDELWDIFQDRSRREFMDADVQAVLLESRVKAQEPEFRNLREALRKERQNKDFPGNNHMGGDAPKSQEYYRLLSEENKMFQDQASHYLTAAYAIGLDKSDNEYIKSAFRAGSTHATQWQQDSDGIYTTYWSTGMTQLIHAVDAHNRRSDVQEKWEKAKNNYSSSAESRNKFIKQYGRDFKSEQVVPSENLQRARLDFKIQEKLTDLAQAKVNSSNIFNRGSRKKALAASQSELNRLRFSLDTAERIG